MSAIPIPASASPDVQAAFRAVAAALARTSIPVPTHSVTPSGSVSGGPLAILRGGTNSALQSTNGVAYFDGTKITSAPGLTFSSNNLACLGNVRVGAVLTVIGAATLAALTATSGAFSTTLGVTGDFAVNTSKFTVAAATGNAVIAGSLTMNDLKIAPWGGGASYEAISLNGSVATGDYNFISRAADTNLYINRPLGKTIFIGENNNQTDLVIATGGAVTFGGSSIKMAALPTSAGASGTLWVDTGAANVVKRVP